VTQANTSSSSWIARNASPNCAATSSPRTYLSGHLPLLPVQ
jgi:hypothetical protein